MECGIMTLWRQAVTWLLDRGRKYGASLSHELADFLFISMDTDRGIGIRNAFLKSQTDVV